MVKKCPGLLVEWYLSVEVSTKAYAEHHPYLCKTGLKILPIDYFAPFLADEIFKKAYFLSGASL